MPTLAGTIKTIGSNGQISLGKQFAGRQVLVEEREPGVWLIRTARVVPDNEQWLQQPSTLGDLRSAVDWAQRHPAQETDLNALTEKLHEAA